MTELNINEMIREIVRQENESLFRKIEKKFESELHKNENKKILTFNEACNFLNCSKSYLYKMTSTNQIPHSKRGKKLFFESDVLANWLLKNKVKTYEEINNDLNKLLAS